MAQFESQSLSVECAGEVLWLHPSRVIYWPSQRTLLAADIHVGKEHLFGRQGIAMPGGISEASLNTLFQLTKLANAEKLFILGDFMHALPSHGESWLKQLGHLIDLNKHLQISIVAGNHDRSAARVRIDQRIRWYDQSTPEGPFVLQHEPGEDPRGYVLCGHLHPAWRISASRRASVRTPAFWFRRHCAVLPAFGEFTGGMIVKPDPDIDRLFMAAPDKVIEVPVSAGKRRS